MAVVLVRIDDRLVHGQVVEGWLKAVRVAHIIVMSDSVAEDDTQKALYVLAVPHGVRLSCLSVRETAAAWLKDAWGEERAMILTATPQEVLALVEKGVTLSSVNVGGLHFREGRLQILKAVSVDDQDVAAFKALSQRGILLEVRPLPMDDPANLSPYLERWEQERQALRDMPR